MSVNNLWLVTHLILTRKYVKYPPPPSLSGLSQPAITVSFELLGTKGNVSPHNLRTGHVMGVCNIFVYPYIDDFKDINLN